MTLWPGETWGLKEVIFSHLTKLKLIHIYTTLFFKQVNRQKGWMLFMSLFSWKAMSKMIEFILMIKIQEIVDRSFFSLNTSEDVVHYSILLSS